MNLVDLATYTRDLTGVYAKDTVTDTILYRFINEGYRELARMNTWPWLPVTDLVATPAPTSPAFDAEFHAVLAYRAAVKVLRFTSDDTPRGEAYMQEYAALVKDMEVYYLSANATGTSGTLLQMTRLVRDLTGVYDADQVTDALIKVYINNAYNELARARDWDWLETTTEVPMPAFTGGRHTVNLSGGTRRILEAYVVSPDGYTEAMVPYPSLLTAQPNDAKCFYDVNFAGQMTFAPEQDAANTVRVRYTQANVNLGDSDGPAFADQFDMILVFRAAMNVLAQVTPDDPRIGVYGEEYTSLLDGMVTMYELDHDTMTFQLGQEGVRTVKYFPWFKPA